jgi:phosphomannomutase
MQRIKFGTDGWRAVIAHEFTVENVRRISEGVARWLMKYEKKTVVIGYDTRFGSRLFSRSAAEVLASMGLRVFLSDDFCTTPMVSLATQKLGADLGIVITASHNPPEYNGFKLKGPHGGPAFQHELREIEQLIPEKASASPATFDEYLGKGLIEYTDLEKPYLLRLQNHFDLDTLSKFSPEIAYDSMFGAGKKLMKKLFPGATHLHETDNPGFEGISPEPIDRNLTSLEQVVKENPRIKIGIAHDGDADRIGLFDEDGSFVDSHHILLLLLYYLVRMKKEKGKILASAAVTEKLENMARHEGLPFEYTPIGFKHITPLMLREGVLLAGEEAGGMAVRDHLPERDGIYISLMILEFMRLTGKSLKELVGLIHSEVGAFAYDRVDLHLDEAAKMRIVEKCTSNRFTQIAGNPIHRIQLVDGWRYFLGEDKWLMIRPSGTEPVLRLYAQDKTKEAVRELLNRTIRQLME